MARYEAHINESSALLTIMVTIFLPMQTAAALWGMNIPVRRRLTGNPEYHVSP